MAGQIFVDGVGTVTMEEYRALEASGRLDQGAQPAVGAQGVDAAMSEPQEQPGVLQRIAESPAWSLGTGGISLNGIMEALRHPVDAAAKFVNDYSVPEAVAGTIGYGLGSRVGMGPRGGVTAVGLERALEGLLFGEDPVNQTIPGMAGQMAMQGAPGLARPIQRTGEAITGAAVPVFTDIAERLRPRAPYLGRRQAIRQVMDAPGGVTMEGKENVARETVNAATRSTDREVAQGTARGVRLDLNPALDTPREALGPRGSLVNQANTPSGENTTRRTFRHLEDKFNTTRPMTPEELTDLLNQPGGFASLGDSVSARGGSGGQRGTVPMVREPALYTPEEALAFKRKSKYTPFDPRMAGSDEVQQDVVRGVGDIIEDAFPQVGVNNRISVPNIDTQQILSNALGHAEASSAVAAPRAVVSSTMPHPFFMVPVGKKTTFATGNLIDQVGQAVNSRELPALLRVLLGMITPDDPTGGPQKRQFGP